MRRCRPLGSDAKAARHRWVGNIPGDAVTGASHASGATLRASELVRAQAVLETAPEPVADGRAVSGFDYRRRVILVTENDDLATIQR